MKVLVAGGGPVARSLALGLRRAGLEVVTWTRGQGRAGSTPIAATSPTAAPAATSPTTATSATTATAATTATEPGDPEGPPRLALIAVSDAAIGEVAARLLDEQRVGEGAVLLHTAGAVPPSVAFAAVGARVGGVGLLHPLRAFARAVTVDDLAGTVFGVAGDAAGSEAAVRLAGALGGVVLRLDEGSLPRYHAAAALASNHTLALVGAAIDLLTAEGLARESATSAIAALLRSAADNVASTGLPAALTGPIARGDEATVARHLASLPPALLPLYRVTGLGTVDLARAQGRAEPAALDRLEALLASGITNDSQSKR